METIADLSNESEKHVPVPLHELTAQLINKLDPFRYWYFDHCTRQIQVFLGMIQLGLDMMVQVLI